jgi:hypothetical protein
VSTSSGFQFYYGTGDQPYIHPKGEVYPESIEIIPRFGEEGVRWAADYIWRLRGNFLDTIPTRNPVTAELSMAEITTRINNMRTAYNRNYQNCGFLDDNGNQTSHVLTSNSNLNLSGNRVTRRSWDNLSPTEYANTRSFSFTIQALMSMADSQIISFKEGVSKTGTGGPTWKVRETWSGEPYKYFLTRQSKVVHVQQGEIVSLGSWFSPPSPYWPLEEMQEHRVITMHTPRYHGNGIPTHYRTTYKYVFERLGDSPNFRPNSGWGA